MSRHYQLGTVPWSVGTPVPTAVYAPPPNLAVARGPWTSTTYAVGPPKPPVPPPPPTTVPPPSKTP
eukprot:8951373-Lingulodinium_polyedra.AAC.1